MTRGSEAKAAELLRKVGGLGNGARDLAYRLYSICERRGWNERRFGLQPARHLLARDRPPGRRYEHARAVGAGLMSPLGKEA